MKPEQVHSFIRSRHSVRRFKPDPIPEQILNRILETASYAPSAHNRQPWRVAIVRSMEARQKLAVAMGNSFERDLLAGGMAELPARGQVERSRRRIIEAPTVLILSLDTADVDPYPDEKRKVGEIAMGRQSVALFGGTLLLAAHAEGLGGVWVCAPLFAPLEARESLDLPENWEPQGMILLGYPLQIPEARASRSVSEFTKTL